MWWEIGIRVQREMNTISEKTQIQFQRKCFLRFYIRFEWLLFPLSKLWVLGLSRWGLHFQWWCNDKIENSYGRISSELIQFVFLLILFILNFSRVITIRNYHIWPIQCRHDYDTCSSFFSNVNRALISITRANILSSICFYGTEKLIKPSFAFELFLSDCQLQRHSVIHLTT